MRDRNLLPSVKMLDQDDPKQAAIRGLTKELASDEHAHDISARPGPGMIPASEASGVSYLKSHLYERDEAASRQCFRACDRCYAVCDRCAQDVNGSAVDAARCKRGKAACGAWHLS